MQNLNRLRTSIFVPCGATAQIQPKPPHLRGSISHTIRHTTPLNERSVHRKGRYLQKTQQTNVHVLSAIRTGDPRNQAAADIRLGLQGQNVLLYLHFYRL